MQTLRLTRHHSLQPQGMGSKLWVRSNGILRQSAGSECCGSSGSLTTSLDARQRVAWSPEIADQFAACPNQDENYQVRKCTDELRDEPLLGH